MKFDIKGSVVLITGGTGTFGKAFLDKCLVLGAREVRIFSRDEKKQYDMMQMYREHPEVRFFLGDIRDKTTIDKAMPGVDFVFHAADFYTYDIFRSFQFTCGKYAIFLFFHLSVFVIN